MMKKVISKKILTLCAVAAVACALPLAASAADKLAVKNIAGDANVFTVDDTGVVYAAEKLGVGAQSAIYPMYVSDGATYYAGFADWGIDAARAHTAVNGCPNWQTHRSRGTDAAPTSVVENDRIGKFNFKGYSAEAGDYLRTAWIAIEIDGEPNTAGDLTDMPGRIIFYVSPDGSDMPIEQMRVSNDGAVSFNNLKGPHSNGSAFVCVDNGGVIYASETSCP